jgi:hypothetical protein
VSGYVLQVVFAILPWLVLERVALVVHARRSALRLAFVAAVGYLAMRDLSTVLSTVDFPADSSAADGHEWGDDAVRVALAALFQLTGVLAVVETTRLIERATVRRASTRQQVIRAAELL